MTATFLPLRSQLGPYQILGLLGVGGMGEVYRARDTRLQRDVAVKVLPPAFADDRELMRRLEREARAVSQLNHPNIVAVYDIGSEEGFEYVVMELLEGETLAKKLESGPLSTRKALDYATQIVRGLTAAHEKDIVHRDLKPDNVFLTRDGRLKILDFGLARHASPHASNQSARLTTPGMVVGTAAYMSPEQARGLVVDHRSDIFSFGVVLYEMLSGKNPFQADTALETMTAIIHREPEDLGQFVPDLPPMLHRVVSHCLEKQPEARFQTANDLVFDLENCSGIAWSATTARVALPREKAGPPWRLISIAAGVLAIVAVAAILWTQRMTAKAVPEPTFQRLTFRRGIIESARFTEDGGTVVYSASWDGQPLRLQLLRTDRPESQSLPLPDADLAGISPTGDMAILLHGKVFDWWGGGTLAQVPVLGGTPREILEGVVLADWSPDGRIAAWRNTNTGPQIEYPLGHVLYKTNEIVMALRVSPKGDRIAVHIAGKDMTGEVAVIGLDGKKHTLVPKVVSSPGMAWTPDGKEVWFAGSPVGGTSMPSIYAVNLAGEQRLVARMTGWLWLHDISRDGSALLSYNTAQSGIILQSAAEPRPRELTWLDGSVVADISSDGQKVLFSEAGEGVQFVTTIYMRGTDDSPAVRLGEGVALAFSPKNDFVLARRPGPHGHELILLPTYAGKIVEIRNGLDCLWAGWLPDGRILISAQTPQGPRLFVQSPAASSAQPLTPVGMSVNAVVDPEGGGGVKPISPDGRWIVAVDEQRQSWLVPIGADFQQRKHLASVTAADRIAGWSRDGSRLYVYDRLAVPIRVDEVVLATGERKPFQELSLSDLGGIFRIGPVLLMPDGRSFAYGYYRTLSTLYMAKGLR